MTNIIQTGIHKAIAGIMKGVDFIKKDRKNAAQGYNFRGIDDMYNALHGLFADAGVFISSEITNTRREERTNTKGTLLIWTIVDACFTFYAEDGSFVKTTMVGEAMDSGDKGCNKAMSAALKYALMQMLLIPTEESKDTEDDTHQLAAGQQKIPTGNKEAETLGIPPEKKPIRTKTVITQKQFEQAVERIQKNDEHSQGVYDNTVKYFDLSQAQLDTLSGLLNSNPQKKTA
ncbi:ERF superfamily protein [Chitinophaga polysaccharea]|uniref:ERF superfamily protein n=1 Tax=Chitinophaga polysaccharea TaxID=1293035 RepID=A0A561PL53_9BACT|nr:ERF family protein [Chitinophaga polysaccharea]TWF38832.1 ERF superfamily protein [Chitinophaga polysaccharea]